MYLMVLNMHHPPKYMQSVNISDMTKCLSRNVLWLIRKYLLKIYYMKLLGRTCFLARILSISINGSFFSCRNFLHSLRDTRYSPFLWRSSVWEVQILFCWCFNFPSFGYWVAKQFLIYLLVFSILLYRGNRRYISWLQWRENTPSSFSVFCPYSRSKKMLP